MRSTATRSDALDQLVAALQSGVCDQVAARDPGAPGLRARPRRRHPGAARRGTAHHRTAGADARRRFAQHAVRQDSGVQQAQRHDAPWPTPQTPRRPRWPSRPPSPHADADRRTQRASPEGLPVLRRIAATLPAQPHAAHRRPAREPAVGRHRAYDSPRLLPAVQEARRAGRAGRLAQCHLWPPAGELRQLVPLRPGRHARPAHRHPAVPPAYQALGRRAERDLAAAGGHSHALVRTACGRSQEIGLLARRRDRLAGSRPDLLAVVFCQWPGLLLPD